MGADKLATIILMTESISPQFPAGELSVTIGPGFPSIHEEYRSLRDQRDMVCGAYTLTYLLRAYGITHYDNNQLTVDDVAALAGTGLEERNQRRQNAIRDQIEDGKIPASRAKQWYPSEYLERRLQTVETGGTSVKGVVKACERASDGLVSAIPVPSIIDGEVQLTRDRFETIVRAFLADKIPGQLMANYNMSHTFAPASLLGHKYNFTSLFTQWDNIDYFRTMDWDIGHFTSIAGIISREGYEQQYLVIRDSYKTFGWNGYHLQPLSLICDGVVREEDHRDGGLIIVVPNSATDTVMEFLEEINMKTGLWDNGSPYAPLQDNE